MITQNNLCTCKGKIVFNITFSNAVDPNKCLKEIELPISLNTFANFYFRYHDTHWCYGKTGYPAGYKPAGLLFYYYISVQSRETVPWSNFPLQNSKNVGQLGLFSNSFNLER